MSLIFLIFQNFCIVLISDLVLCFLDLEVNLCCFCLGIIKNFIHIHSQSLELWCYAKRDLFSSLFNVYWLSLGEVNPSLPFFVFILVFLHEHPSKLYESVHLQDFNVFSIGFGVWDGMDDVEM